jgi:hypothetical protein
MRVHSVVSAVVVGLVALGSLISTSAVAEAQTRHGERRPGAGTPAEPVQTRVQPFQFGSGALAAWMVGAGIPVAGDIAQYGLYLQKGTQTSSFAAAGGSIEPLPAGLNGANLSELSFAISGYQGQPFGTANGYCNNGAPRFNVSSNNGTCFLACAHGDRTQDPATGWWTISFTPPFNGYLGCEGGISGRISGIEVILDEGTDVGPGNVVLDNITIKQGSGKNVVVGGPKLP